MKLLILSSSTGGGHDMRASALLNGWNDHGHEGCISRPLDDGFLAYRMGAEFYNLIQVKMPWFHQFYFRFCLIFIKYEFRKVEEPPTSYVTSPPPTS